MSNIPSGRTPSPRRLVGELMNHYVTFVEEVPADKKRAIRHWNSRTCGTEVSGTAFTGLDFGVRIDRNRDLQNSGHLSHPLSAVWAPKVDGSIHSNSVSRYTK